MARSKLYLIIQSGLLFTLLILLPACSRPLFEVNQTPQPTLPTAENPPIYPDARNMKEEFEGHIKTAYLRRITYDTSGEPDKVVDFYKNVLEKDGWRSTPPDDQAPNELYYTWQNGMVHGFTVRVQKTSTNLTSVELILSAGLRP